LVPLELADSTKPQQEVNFLISLPEVTVDSTLWIRKYAYKMDYLDLEERLKKEMLKPQVDLRYSPLLQPTSNDLFLPFSANNMKWGVTASFPLFLRKERGELQSVRLKQQDNQYEMEAKILELKNKLEATSFLITSLQTQIALQEDMIESYLLMRNAELQKFEIGESSLFLVNSREMKYIESRQKLIELKAKLEVAKAEFRWLSAEI
ncbi:MAG: TolC family protein, partial [Flavobacteriales bacterium]